MVMFLEVYSEPNQTLKMEFIAKIVNSWEYFNIFLFFSWWKQLYCNLPGIIANY